MIKRAHKSQPTRPSRSPHRPDRSRSKWTDPKRRRKGRPRRIPVRMSATGCAPTRAPVPPYAATDRALALSHALLVDQVANLTVVVVQLWELNAALQEALGRERTVLPLAGSLACGAGRGVPTGNTANSC